MSQYYVRMVGICCDECGEEYAAAREGDLGQTLRNAISCGWVVAAPTDIDGDDLCPNCQLKRSEQEIELQQRTGE